MLTQIDFENRLIQRNWIFTLGLGLVLNKMHLLLISPCDLSINVTLNVSIINRSFSAAFLIQSSHTNNLFWLATSSYLVGFILLPLKYSINFSLDLLGTSLLYLLDIMMNSSFRPVHNLVCHLDLN